MFSIPWLSSHSGSDRLSATCEKKTVRFPTDSPEAETREKKIDHIIVLLTDTHSSRAAGGRGILAGRGQNGCRRSAVDAGLSWKN